MSLDATIYRQPKSVNLYDLYAILDAIEDTQNLYLGDDREVRESAYNQKLEELKKLDKSTLSSLLNDANEPEMSRHISNMSDRDFIGYMTAILDSIYDFTPGNTHIGFNYDRLFGEEIATTCSWTLHDMIVDAATATTVQDSPAVSKYGDILVELDPIGLETLYNNFTRMAKWIPIVRFVGWFFPVVAGRMLESMLEGLGLSDSYLDLIDLENFKRILESIHRGVSQRGDAAECGYWLSSSY